MKSAEEQNNKNESNLEEKEAKQIQEGVEEENSIQNQAETEEKVEEDEEQKQVDNPSEESEKEQKIKLISFPLLHKDIKKKIKPSSTEKSVPQLHNKEGIITGAGTLLWEWVELTKEECERKSEILKKDVIYEGYTILLFGQVEKKGKFKGRALFTDPGGKVDGKESAQKVASRELFEESCGMFDIGEDKFVLEKSFRMGDTYVLFNILLEDNIHLPDFSINHQIISHCKEAPSYYLESNQLTRVFVREIDLDALFKSTQIFEMPNIYGEMIQIGRRSIAILKSLRKSQKIYNFIVNEILLPTPVKLKKVPILDDSKLLIDFPWIKGIASYKDSIEDEKEDS